LTNSQVKLNILHDTQELLNNSHHKIAFHYDKDTVSVVEESNLTTLEISLSNNSDSSAGNAYEIKADAILKQELPVTICTADTIGTILS
jgi:hypothetical protein